MITCNPRIGVLGLQGAFSKHLETLTRLGIDASIVRYAHEITRCDGLIIPGGESTTMSRLIDDMGLRNPLTEFDRPIFGTCAGAVLLGTGSSDPRVETLKKTPVAVKRNGYGRQIDSFTTDLQLTWEDRPCQAVFIRAPRFTAVTPECRILACLGEEPVLIHYRQYLLCAFHPELTADSRIHDYFIRNCFNDRTV